MSDGITTKLLDRWHSGDQDALEALLDRHLTRIRVMVQTRLGHALKTKLETGDVIQDAVMEFLRYGPRFRINNGAQLRHPLALIVRNVIRDHHASFTAQRRDMRRELNDHAVIDFDSQRDANPSEAAAENEESTRVRLALELLPPSKRRLILARDWDRRTHSEIAAEFDLTEDAVRMRYKRAIQELRTLVGKIRERNIVGLLEYASEPFPEGE